MMPYRGTILLLLLFLRGIISSLVYYWFTDIQYNAGLWEGGRGSSGKVREKEKDEISLFCLFIVQKNGNLPLLFVHIRRALSSRA